MQNPDHEKILQIDMAMVQLITTILVTLGSTLVAISIGFGLTLPSILTQVVNQVAETDVRSLPESIPSETITQEARVLTIQLFQESINNYVFLLAAFGVFLIVIGIMYSSAKINKMKKEIMRSSQKDRYGP
jgi:hypothetical protein